MTVIRSLSHTPVAPRGKLRSGRLIALVASLLICLAPAASAVDGVIEINESRAHGGAVTSGDTPGYPVTISEAGSYRLTGNLDVRSELNSEDVTAISITASHVTLDLNGFTIRGPLTCTSTLPRVCGPLGAGRGIDAETALQNVSVTNGRVVGMGSDGVWLPRYSSLHDVQARENGADGLHVGPKSIVVRCSAGLNLGDGIAAGATSILAANVVSNNSERGILAAGTSVLQDNAAALNIGNGIEVTSVEPAGVETASGSVVLGNASRTNGGHGLQLEAGVGFGRNAVTGNFSGTASGGVKIADNLCGTNTTCP